MSILVRFRQCIQWVRFVFGWGYVTAFLHRSFSRHTGLPTNFFKLLAHSSKMLGTGGPFWLAGAEVFLRPVPPAWLLAVLAVRCWLAADGCPLLAYAACCVLPAAAAADAAVAANPALPAACCSAWCCYMLSPPAPRRAPESSSCCGLCPLSVPACLPASLSYIMPCDVLYLG